MRDQDFLEVVQRLWYYPFGMHLQGIGQLDVDPSQRYRYNGKEFDQSTGLYDYGFRYYDPSIGRFTGVDPIAGNFADLSVYNYASNDPIKNIDLHGLQGVSAIGGPVAPSAAGVLYETFQSARAGLFNMEMRALEYFGYSSSNRGEGFNARMRVNFDDYGGINPDNPVTIFDEPAKAPLAEAIDIGLDLLSFTPAAELGAARGMNGVFLAARVPSSSLKNLISTEPGAQGRRAINDIVDRMNSGDLFIFNEPIHTVKVNGNSYILDGHNRIEAAIESGHDLHITNLPETKAAQLYPDKYKQIIDGDFN